MWLCESSELVCFDLEIARTCYHKSLAISMLILHRSLSLCSRCCMVKHALSRAPTSDTCEFVNQCVRRTMQRQPLLAACTTVVYNDIAPSDVGAVERGVDEAERVLRVEE